MMDGRMLASPQGIAINGLWILLQFGGGVKRTDLAKDIVLGYDG
jgi:hypothetical protein